MNHSFALSRRYFKIHFFLLWVTAISTQIVQWLNQSHVLMLLFCLLPDSLSKFVGLDFGFARNILVSILFCTIIRVFPTSGIFRQIGASINTVQQSSSKLLGAEIISTATNFQQTRPKCQAGRYRVTLRRNRPLTYEMANKPSSIGVRKGWNSWNTTSVTGCEHNASEVTIEDMFIRQFISGTWHRLFLSEVILKRRGNLIVICGIVHQAIPARKYYWLIGYTEEILARLLKCPIKVDLQTTFNKNALVYKYI